jgi:hypothetical protein
MDSAVVDPRSLLGRRPVLVVHRQAVVVSPLPTNLAEVVVVVGVDAIV